MKDSVEIKLMELSGAFKFLIEAQELDGENYPDIPLGNGYITYSGCPHCQDGEAMYKSSFSAPPMEFTEAGKLMSEKELTEFIALLEKRLV